MECGFSFPVVRNKDQYGVVSITLGAHSGFFSLTPDEEARLGFNDVAAFGVSVLGRPGDIRHDWRASILGKGISREDLSGHSGQLAALLAFLSICGNLSIRTSNPGSLCATGLLDKEAIGVAPVHESAISMKVAAWREFSAQSLLIVPEDNWGNSPERELLPNVRTVARGPTALTTLIAELFDGARLVAEGIERLGNVQRVRTGDGGLDAFRQDKQLHDREGRASVGAQTGQRLPDRIRLGRAVGFGIVLAILGIVAVSIVPLGGFGPKRNELDAGKAIAAIRSPQSVVSDPERNTDDAGEISCEQTLTELRGRSPAEVERFAQTLATSPSVGKEKSRDCFEKALLVRLPSLERVLFGATGLEKLRSGQEWGDDFFSVFQGIVDLAGQYQDAAVAWASWEVSRKAGSPIRPPESAERRLKELEVWLVRLPIAPSKRLIGVGGATAACGYPRLWRLGDALATWQWLDQCGSDPGQTAAKIMRRWLASCLNVAAVWLPSKETCPSSIASFGECVSGGQAVFSGRRRVGSECEIVPPNVKAVDAYGRAAPGRLPSGSCNNRRHVCVLDWANAN